MQRPGVGGGRRIARAQPAVDVLEGLLLVLGGILLQALDDDPVVQRGIDHLDLGDAQFGDLLDDRLGQRLEGAGHHQALLGVDGVLDEHLVGEVFALFGLLDAEVLDLVEQLEDFLVGAGLIWLSLPLASSPGKPSRGRRWWSGTSGGASCGRDRRRAGRWCRTAPRTRSRGRE